MSGTTFGGGMSVSGASYDLAVTGDMKAFTIRFSDLQLDVGDGAGSPMSVAGRMAWVVMPLDGTEKGVEITFVLSGYAIAADGAVGSLALRVGGRTSVVEFPSGSDREIEESVTYTTTGSEAEVHLAVCAMVERDGPDGGVSNLSLTAIDGNIPLDRPA